MGGSVANGGWSGDRVPSEAARTGRWTTSKGGTSRAPSYFEPFPRLARVAEMRSQPVSDAEQVRQVVLLDRARLDPKTGPRRPAACSCGSAWAATQGSWGPYACPGASPRRNPSPSTRAGLASTSGLEAKDGFDVPAFMADARVKARANVPLLARRWATPGSSSEEASPWRLLWSLHPRDGQRRETARRRARPDGRVTPGSGSPAP